MQLPPGVPPCANLHFLQVQATADVSFLPALAARGIQMTPPPVPPNPTSTQAWVF